MSPNHIRAMSRLWNNETPSLATVVALLRPPIALGLFSILICSCGSGCQSTQKRITRRSTQCGSLCAQAREAREKGNKAQENRYIDEALRQRPSDIETRRQLAETMWAGGRKDEAIAQYASLSEQFPTDEKLVTRLAVMQWEVNQHSAAVNTAMAVLQLDPQSKEALLIKARNEVAEGQLDAALVSYLQLSQVDSEELSSLKELGDLHLKRGCPDRACPLLRTASQHPQASAEQRAEIEWLLGVAYARSERWTFAVSTLESAITKRHATAEDWCFLGSARLQIGDLTGARSDLRHAMQKNPESLAIRKLAQQLESTADSSISENDVTPVNFHSTR